jgi:UDP-GlcNAc:undecaprenyl-phosphate GlcNAc-1-phosphate transferase
MLPDGPASWLLAFGTALGVAFASVAVLRSRLAQAGVLDRPGHRSSHHVPTPRGGGIGIVLGFVVGLAVGASALPGTSASDFSLPGMPALALLTGALIVAAVGLADDVRSLPVAARLGAQVLASLVLLGGAGGLEAIRLPWLGELRLGLVEWPLTVVWVVAVTNIYNFMDGIDGLAAGQAAIAGGFLALSALQVGNPVVMLTSLSLAGAALGFLPHNLPPARIFMGDVGSTFLGFSFAALAVIGARPGDGRISVYVTVLLLAPFLFDASLTLVSRIWRGERWYEPHRSHLYQRLVRAGYSHARVGLVYYLLALVLGALGFAEVATGQGANEIFMALALAPLVLLVLWVRHVEATTGRGTTRMPT